MPRLTKAQRAELAALDAQIVARTTAWQQQLDDAHIDPISTCMGMMLEGLRGLYPVDVTTNGHIAMSHLMDLYPRVNDPEFMFQVISEHLATMNADEFEALLREPVFAYTQHSGVDDINPQLSNIDNYFGMLNAAREDHRYWIDVYRVRYDALSKLWWKTAPVRSDQRYALLFAFATSVFIMCRPAVFQEKFYRFAFSLHESTLFPDELAEHFGIFEVGQYENKLGSSAARGLTEIELSVQMLTNFFATYPAVLARMHAGV